MAFFNRKLYRQKPKQWGKPSQVQSSIFANAERAGIPLPCSFVPTWENAGNKVLDYLYNVQGTKQGNWKNNALTEIDFDRRVNITIPSVLKQGGSSSAVFSFELHGIIASNYQNTVILFIQAASATAYTMLQYSYSNEKFSFASYNGTFTTTGTYGDFVYDFPATHFVFTIDSPNNQIKIYADGKLLETVTGTSQWPLTNGNINYGGAANTTGVIRRLNYAKLWHNVILTPDQVAYSHDNPYFLLHRQPSVFYSVPSGAITLRQFGFRFYQDNAAPGSATALGDQDANISLAPGSKFRLRVGIDADGDPASKDFQLEYKHKPSGGTFGDWGKVT